MLRNVSRSPAVSPRYRSVWQVLLVFLAAGLIAAGGCCAPYGREATQCEPDSGDHVLPSGTRQARGHERIYGAVLMCRRLIFAGIAGGGVFLSTNNGTSWIAVNTGLTNYTVYALTVSGTNPIASACGTVNGVSDGSLMNQLVNALDINGVSHLRQ